MRPRIVGLGAASGAAIAAAAIAGTLYADRGRPGPEAAIGRPGEARSRGPSSPIDELDYRVQERFRDLEGFGMSRLPVRPEHLRRFDPETGDEKAAVSALRDGGWAVAMYLGGRALLDPPPAEEDDPGPFERIEPIGPPIVVSGDVAPADLPEPGDLRAIGRRALEASASSDRYAATLGRWAVDARYVRASRQDCLTCHAGRGSPGLKIGDALGVALYVYARDRRR